MLILPLLALPSPPSLVVDGYVVAARKGGKWAEVNRGQGWPKFGTTTFREIGVARLGRTMRAGFGDEDVPQGVYLKGGMIDISGVLVGGITPTVPRRAQELPATSPVYARALRGYLDRNGLRGAKARIKRIVSVDLDGDGTREVLIEARSADDLDRRSLTALFGPNDYSVVLLRALRNGKVVDIPLDLAAGRKGDQLVRKLRAVADMDGDGRMEIVLSYSAWESFGGSLWSYRAGSARRLVQNGSGV